MAENEYYESAPGQTFEQAILVGQKGQAPTTSKTQQSALRRPPSKGHAEDYFTPNAPNSAFTAAAYVADSAPVDDVLPVPPPRFHNTGNFQSPPAPQDPGSPVTDESDGSIVHIHHNPHHNDSPNTNASSPSHQSASLSLTHSNLEHHNGFGSEISPSRGHGPASKRRLRPRELSTHSKDTLIQLLIRQEYQTEDCKKTLKKALEKLERYKSDLADANSHCRRVEKLYQKLADERMLMQSQVSDGVGKAQQQTFAAQQELSIFKLKLEHTENSLASVKAELREVKLQRDKARSDAERSREEAHRFREERNVYEAREQGRKRGYDEGVKQGHVLGVTQTIPRATPSAGEPSAGSVAAPSNPNTSGTSTHSQRSRARTATSQSDQRSSSSRGQQDNSKINVEDLVQKIRRETEERYQRQFDQQLEQERQRLHILKLEEDQEREREVVEEREKFRQAIEARERQRAAELEVEMENLRRLERQRSEEVRNEQQKSNILQLERDTERQLKEKEQHERRRERQVREQERAEEARRHEQEQRLVSMQRQMERTEALKRDQERDRTVAEATAQAARAAAQANAAASTSASRPKSRTSGSSSDNELGRRTPLAAPVYFPMPRPPVGMPIPAPAQPPITIPPSMSMPEPNVNHSRQSSRSGGQPQPPVTMPEPDLHLINNSRSSSRSAQRPVTIPATVSMPEPNINPNNNSRPSSRSAGQPNLPSTVPGRHRPRRSSMESQSSVSTVAGGLDKLVTFPMPGGGPGRAPSTNSGGPAFIPPLPESSTRSNNRQSSHSRNASYNTRLGGVRDALSDIPEDASFRLSPGVSSPYGGQGPVIPPLTMSEPSHSGPPVIPNIRVESDRGRAGSDRGSPRADDNYLHAPGQQQLQRSNSDSSIYGITVIPPSGPSTPLEGGPDAPHPHSAQDPNLLSPHHIPAPVLPQVPSQQPILQRRAESPPLPIRMNVRGRSGTVSSGDTGGGGGGDSIPTQPNSPVIPDAQYFPPNFVPQTFTPHANATPSLPGDEIPEVVINPPPGFIPQSVTDIRTGITTPLTGINPLPGGSDENGGGSRRQSIYGNSENWRGASSPYVTSSPLPLGGPPVIPTFDDADNLGSSNRGTPRGGIYTPGGTSRNLPGTPSVYQNPVEGDEEGDNNDDLVARNTRINATAPPVGGKQKKKKRR